MNKFGILYSNTNVRSFIDVCIHVLRGTITATKDTKYTDVSTSKSITTTNIAIKAIITIIKSYLNLHISIMRCLSFSLIEDELDVMLVPEVCFSLRL